MRTCVRDICTNTSAVRAGAAWPRDDRVCPLVRTAAHHGVLPNLDFVTAGDMPPNPSELLLHKSWTELLAQASRSVDLVLVDVPPVLAVSDVEAIAGTAGTVFLVARYGVTRLAKVTESIRRLQKAGFEVTGLLFNSVKARGGLHDGRGETYQYTDYGYYRDHA